MTSPIYAYSSITAAYLFQTEIHALEGRYFRLYSRWQVRTVFPNGGRYQQAHIVPVMIAGGGTIAYYPQNTFKVAA